MHAWGGEAQLSAASVHAVMGKRKAKFLKVSRVYEAMN